MNYWNRPFPLAYHPYYWSYPTQWVPCPIQTRQNKTDATELIKRVYFLPEELRIRTLRHLLPPVIDYLNKCIEKIDVKQLTAESYVHSVAFNPTSELMAAGTNMLIPIWNVTNANIVRELGQDIAIFSVSYSPDGKQIASGGKDLNGFVTIQDAETGEIIQSLAPPDTPGFATFVYSIAYNPTGEFLVAGTSNDVIVWDLSTGDVKHALLRGIDLMAGSVAYSPDGNFIAAGLGDGRIIIWDASTGALVRTISGHSKSVTSIGYSPKGESIISGSLDNTVRIWSTTSGELLHTINTESAVGSVSYSPIKKLIAYGLQSGVTKIVHARTFKTVKTIQGEPSNVYYAVFSPNGEFFASGSRNTINLWNTTPYLALQTMSKETESLTSGQLLMLYVLHLNWYPGLQISLRQVASAIRNKYGDAPPDLVDLVTSYRTLNPTFKTIVQSCFNIVDDI